MKVRNTIYLKKQKTLKSDLIWGILGFHQSCDQTKNRNQSKNKFKNLGYDRQSNLSNTDTEGTEQSVRIREVSVA